MEENIPLMRSNAKAGSLIEVTGVGWLDGGNLVNIVGYGGVWRLCDLCHLNHHISC